MVLLKRVRGLVTSMVLWSVPWALFGVVVGLTYVWRLWPDTFIIGANMPGGVPVALGLAGAMIGAVNGLIFGSILMAAERRRNVTELRWTRLGAWAALATGVTVGIFTGSLALASLCGAFGFGVGTALLRVAQARSEGRNLEAAT